MKVKIFIQFIYLKIKQSAGFEMVDIFEIVY